MSTPLTKKPAAPACSIASRSPSAAPASTARESGCRELGADAARRFDAVHVRHRDVHQDDIGPQRVRVRDRLESVGRFADDAKLRPLVEHLAQRAAHRRVIVDDENPERVGQTRGRRRPRMPAPVGARLERPHAGDPPGAAPRGATRRNRVPFPGALSMSSRPPSSVSRSRMLNSPQPTWPAFDRCVEPRRLEPDALDPPP